MDAPLLKFCFAYFSGGSSSLFTSYSFHFGNWFLQFWLVCPIILKNLKFHFHEFLINKILFCFFLFRYVHVFNYFTPERALCKIEDISYGKENVPVSCINSLDNNYPEYVEYSTIRLPQTKVEIPLDEGFLTCCDCTGK